MDRARGKYLIKLKNRAKRLTGGLEAAGLARAERTQVEADVERIRKHLSQPSQLPPGRGVAVFACGPLRLFEVVPLPHVFRSRLVVDHSPLVRELAALASEFGRVMCAAYDRTAAGFFGVSAGGVEELPSLTAVGRRPAICSSLRDLGSGLENLFSVYCLGSAYPFESNYPPAKP